jgi:hypothetical protein
MLVIVLRHGDDALPHVAGIVPDNMYVRFSGFSYDDDSQ